MGFLVSSRFIGFYELVFPQFSVSKPFRCPAGPVEPRILAKLWNGCGADGSPALAMPAPLGVFASNLLVSFGWGKNKQKKNTGRLPVFPFFPTFLCGGLTFNVSLTYTYSHSFNLHLLTLAHFVHPTRNSR